MSGSTRYYLAVVASTLSVAGWIGVAVFGLYAAYLAAVGGPAGLAAAAALVSLLAGAALAKAERALYRVEDLD